MDEILVPFRFFPVRVPHFSFGIIWAIKSCLQFLCTGRVVDVLCPSVVNQNTYGVTTLIEFDKNSIKVL